MGVPGTRPKSTRAHQLEGTFNVTKHRRRRPVKMPKSGSVMAPPDHLSDRQKELWKQTVANAPIDVLARIDAPTVEAYVVAWSRLIEANLAQQRHEKDCATKNPPEDPLLFVTKTGNVIQSPYIGMMNRAMDKVRALAGEMGFTPVSRIRLSAAGDGPDLPTAASPADALAGDDFDKALKGKPN